MTEEVDHQTAQLSENQKVPTVKEIFPNLMKKEAKEAVEAMVDQKEHIVPAVNESHIQEDRLIKDQQVEIVKIDQKDHFRADLQK